MIGLVGIIAMPLSFRAPAQVVRDTAMDPRTNIAQTNRIFFMRPPCPFPIKIYTLWRNESIVASRMLLRSGAPLLLCHRTSRFEPAWLIAPVLPPIFPVEWACFLPRLCFTPNPASIRIIFGTQRKETRYPARINPWLEGVPCFRSFPGRKESILTGEEKKRKRKRG